MWSAFKSQSGSFVTLKKHVSFLEASTAIIEDVKAELPGCLSPCFDNQPGSVQSIKLRTPVPTVWALVSNEPASLVHQNRSEEKEPSDTKKLGQVDEVVEFNWKIEQFHSSSKEREALRRTFRQAFGVEAPTETARLRCRLDQFAKFLILRNEAECRNGFKTLEPRLVSADAVIDLTWRT